MAKKSRGKQRALNVIRKQVQQAKQLANELEKRAPRGVGNRAQAARRNLAATIRSTLKQAKTSAGSVAALRSINAITRNVRSQREAQRSNQVFKQQARLAQLGQPSSLGAAGRAKIKIFYRATQRYWQGKPPQQRDQLIMQALGVQTLDEALSIVLAGNQQALQAAVLSGVDVRTTNDTAFNAESLPDVQGSPDYISLVDMV